MLSVWRTRVCLYCSHHNYWLREQKKRHRPPLPTVASAGGDPLIDNGPCPGVGRKYAAFIGRYPVPVRECFRKMVEFGNHPPTNPPEIFVVRKGNAVPDLRAPCRYPGGPLNLLRHNPPPRCEFNARVLLIASKDNRRHISPAAYPAWPAGDFGRTLSPTRQTGPRPRDCISRRTVCDSIRGFPDLIWF